MSRYVSEDLVIKIFEKLPSKSLLRFRSLSKDWHSRIASPEFIRNHHVKTSEKVLVMQRYSNNDICYHQHKDVYTLYPQDPECSYKGVEYPFYTEIVGSCNGILCLHLKDRISLWNFSIRREITLPTCPCLRKVSNAIFGFGYDNLTNDYKIVGIRYGSRNSDHTRIHTLKTNVWSVIASPPTKLFEAKTHACFFNGALHWVVLGYLKGSPDKIGHFILTFNLSSHVFGVILLPELSWGVGQLTIINDCLAVMSSNANNSWIWVMREYGKDKSWFVPFKLETKNDDGVKVSQSTSYGNMVIYNNKGLVYNPHTKLYTKLLKFGFDDCLNIEMEAYVESLELLDRGTSCGTTIFPWNEKRNPERKISSLNYGDDDDEVDIYDTAHARFRRFEANAMRSNTSKS